MNKLRYLLLYNERINFQGENNIESVQDNIGVLSEKDSISIYEYMSRGLILIEFVSPTIDPITRKADTENIILTDGKYAWDGLLMKWVKDYKVRLPQDFIDWVKNLKYEPKELEKLDKEALLLAFKEAEVIAMMIE